MLLAGYHLGLVRPLLGRLDRVARAAEAVGAGGFDRTPPVDRRDELGLVFAQINRMAARLGRAQRGLDPRPRAARGDGGGAHRRAQRRQRPPRGRSTPSAAGSSPTSATSCARPLTVILAETDLAARGDAVSEAELRDALGVIAARARRLNRRIDDLLRVARSESGQIELEAAPFDAAAGGGRGDRGRRPARPPRPGAAHPRRSRRRRRRSATATGAAR